MKCCTSSTWSTNRPGNETGPKCRYRKNSRRVREFFFAQRRLLAFTRLRTVCFRDIFLHLARVRQIQILFQRLPFQSIRIRSFHMNDVFHIRIFFSSNCSSKVFRNRRESARWHKTKLAGTKQKATARLPPNLSIFHYALTFPAVNTELLISRFFVREAQDGRKENGLGKPFVRQRYDSFTVV